MENLPIIQETLNAAQYRVSINKDVDLDELKKSLLQLNSILPLLNTTETSAISLTTTQLKNNIKQLTGLGLDLYQALKKKDNNGVKWFKTTTETLLWICSKINDELFFPYNRKTGVFIPNNCKVITLKQHRIDQLQGNMKLGLPVVDLEDNKDLVNLYQDTLVNCSLVSSILSVVSSQKHCHKLNKIIIPNESSTQFSVLFHMNGITRIVPIDSSFPEGNGNGNSVREKSDKKAEDQEARNQSSSIVLKDINGIVKWPYLIEKAYIKLYGFQDNYLKFNEQFRGSNFGNDLFVLLGFIPEFFSLGDLNTFVDFKELATHFNNEELLMGLGTGDLTDDEILKFGLVPNHDYSVIGLTEELDGLVLKNPWLNKRDSIVKFSDLFKFNVLYVNWCPDSFQCYQNHSFFQKVKSHPEKDDSESWTDINNDCLLNSIQLTVKISKPTRVWVLLERHMNNISDNIELTWFETDAKVWQANQTNKLVRLTSNNTRFLLTRFDNLVDKSFTGVFQVSSAIGVDNSSSSTSSKTNFYSLHVYSDEPIEIVKPTNKYSFFKNLTDYWTPMQTGGNWLFETYNNNPQFEIEFNESQQQQTANLMVGLLSKRTIQLNISIFDNTHNKFKFLTDSATRS
ncbi:unnamed protein product [Ambrosiozyma monospora]|uniref:Cysteine protease RIM13 n=1 Tax=Ambrosiozyma monospora TaxID=43982 RepID=A0A9W6YVK5_AMBMO|nr:unnamed protein product [Ambrosiozyma monospora]